MKIKVTDKTYDEVMTIKPPHHFKPIIQTAFWRWLLRMVSVGELKAVRFKHTKVGMEKLKPFEPCLILMNHSSFTDLQITSQLFRDRQYHIVCTNDGFVGKDLLMRKLGCIPTAKFVFDTSLVRDMMFCVSTLHSSIIMFPEASYSFDGTETPLPASLGKCIKLLGVPVVLVKTEGAFLRDPLYNNLQKRDVDVSAEVKYLYSPEEIENLDADEINATLKREFAYDHFKTQAAHNVIVDEPFRADGLHRALYKCPKCGTEGRMKGEGTMITCGACGCKHELTTTGKLVGVGNDTAFEFVSDWYAWEREEVRKEITAGIYHMDEEVDILILVDHKSMYRVGSGRLTHDPEGFRLTGCEGKLDYTVKSSSSYSLYADYYWYEIGDVISIGDNKRQYYCFPKDQENAIVAKARLATEELYKMKSKTV